MVSEERKDVFYGINQQQQTRERETHAVSQRKIECKSTIILPPLIVKLVYTGMSSR